MYYIYPGIYLAADLPTVAPVCAEVAHIDIQAADLVSASASLPYHHPSFPPVLVFRRRLWP